MADRAACRFRPGTANFVEFAVLADTVLGDRSTVGHLPLEQVIGVRIPVSQPIPSFLALDQQVERLIVNS